MKLFLLVLVIAVIAVAFMFVSLSITRIRKGRDLQGDVGNNDEMKKKGLECTSKAMMREERMLRGEDCSNLKKCDDSCSGCNGH